MQLEQRFLSLSDQLQERFRRPVKLSEISEVLLVAIERRLKVVAALRLRPNHVQRRKELLDPHILPPNQRAEPLRAQAHEVLDLLRAQLDHRRAQRLVCSQELLPCVLADVQQAPGASDLRRDARDLINAHVLQCLQLLCGLSDVRDRPVREVVCREDVDNVVRNLQRQLGAESRNQLVNFEDLAD
jgi:hypothetical protein